jgi:hypothetical protein
MPRKSPYAIDLTNGERAELEDRSKDYTLPYREVVRAKIILLASKGLGNDRIAARLDTPRQIVSKWRRRFHVQRIPGLDEWPRGGRSLCVNLCAGHNQRQGGVLCRAEPRSWTTL